MSIEWDNLLQNYQSNSHCKHLLLAHLIFVVKYRKRLAGKFSNDIKDILTSSSSTHKFEIDTMEIDQDHIHLLIRYDPTLAISDIVRILKSATTYHLWKKHETFLSSQFWKHRVFWSPSYFACSLGNVSQEIARRYIENQG